MLNKIYLVVPRISYDDGTMSQENCEVVPSSSSTKCVSVDDKNELLINLVEQRPILWDYTLSVKERTTLKKNALWSEISNEMGGGNICCNLQST